MADVILSGEVTAQGYMNVDQVIIDRSDPWWNNNWIYRRAMEIQAPPTGFPINHPIEISINKSVLRQGKVRSDLADFKVTRLITSVPETWEVIPFEITSRTSDYLIKFPLSEALSPNTILSNTYYVYYGNKDLSQNVNVASYSPDEYPIVLEPDSSSITYTRLGEHWVDGVSNVTLARASIQFYGPQIRVYANKGRSVGIINFQIDQELWNAVDLFSLEEEEVEIFESTDLSAGKHTLRMQVTGLKNPSSLSTEVNFTAIHLKYHNEAINVKEEANRTLPWNSALGGAT